MSDSPTSGTFGGVITGTYVVTEGTIDTVIYDGAVFGNGDNAAAVLQGPGTLESSGNASVTQYNGASTQLELTGGLTWDSAGEITQNGGVQFGAAAGDSATFVNEAGGVYDLNGSNAQVTTGAAGTYSFDNAGLLEMTSGGSDTLAVPLDNTGTVSSTNGDLYLSGPVTNSGTLVADGGFLEDRGGALGGTIEALSNSVGLIGTYSVPAATVDTVTFDNANLGWYGDGYAVFAGPGTLVSDGYVNVSQYSGASVQLQLIDGVTWDNAGTVNQTGGVVFGGSTIDTATLINEAGATYVLDGGNAQIGDTAGGTYNFDNAGLLEMTSGGGDTISVPLDNTGTVSSANGSLYLSGPVTNSGTLVADGGFLEVQGGTLGGTIEALSNSVGLIGTYTVPAATVDTVTFDNANLGWYGDGYAVFAGPGTLVSNGDVNVSQYSGASVQLQLIDGVTWYNAGTVNQIGGLVFGGSTIDTATLINEAGATYVLDGGNAQIGDTAGGTYNFDNAGLLEMTSGGGDTISVPLDNTGTVSSANGSLYLSGPVTNSGTLVADGGFLEDQGGTLGGTIEALNNNVGLIGTYTVAAATVDTVTFDNAYLGWSSDGYAVFAGPGTLVSNGNVNINEYDYASVQLLLADGITWDNAGAVTQDGGLVFGGSTIDTATLFNEAGSTYVLNGGNAQISDAGGGTYSFINAGELEMIGGGTDTISVPLTNTGLVTSTNGDLILAGPVTNSGTLLANDGELYIEGGTLGGTIGVGPNGNNAYLTGTYTVAGATTDTVTLLGASFGDGGGAAIAYFSGAGTIATDGSANLTNYYYTDPDLVLENGVTWDNFGAISQNGGMQLGDATGDTATVVNEAGATYTLNGGNASIEMGGTSGDYNVINNGLLQMIGGGGDSIAVPLDNTGVVASNNGELYIDGPLTNTGTFLTGGGSIQIDGGTLGGTLDAANGAIWLTGTYTIAAGATDAVTLLGVTFGDGGGASIAYISGDGTFATTGFASTTNYYYYYPDLVLENGVTWDNFGAITQNGGLQLGNVTGDTATVVNEVGATYTLNGGNADIEMGGTSGTYNFINNGLLQMISGGGASIAVPLDNTAVVSSDNGELYIDGPLTNSGTIQTEGGSIQINGGSLGGTLDAANGTIWLLGTYTVGYSQTDTATLLNVTFGDGDGSSIAYLSGPGTLATSGSASITNYYYDDPDLVLTGGITWDNAGGLSVNGGLQFGNFSGDSATLVNEASGVINLTGGNSDIENGGSGNYSLVDDGLIEMTGGGTDSIAVTVDETATGTVTASNGTLQFDDGATIAGAVNGGATVDFDGGNVTLAATGDITTNTVAFNDGVLFMQGGTIDSPNLSLAPGVEVIGDGVIGDLTNDALIDAAGGLLTVNGNVGGSGSFQIETGATLEIAGSTGQNVSFDGIDATLKLDDLAGFSGTIENLGGGDTIDLPGVTLSAVSYDNSNDTLIGTLVAGGTISLSAPDIAAGLQFELGTDASGASTIYLKPSPVSAVPEILTALGPDNSLVLPDAHVVVNSGPADPSLAIENTATAPADGLDVSIGGTAGDATASGGISSLQPGSIDVSSISVSLNDKTAGAESGTVALDFTSDGAVSGVVSNLGTETLNLSGNVYRVADPSITAPTNVYLHVGDNSGTFTEALTVANTDPADGYSEGLQAAEAGIVTGNLTAGEGSTGDIAAGSSDDSSLTVSFSTDTAGSISGEAAVALVSDGIGVDTLGVTPIEGGTAYSAVDDFSLASNANGVWSYLSDGNLLTATSSGSNHETWSNGDSQPDEAFVTLNPTDTTQTYSGTVVLPPEYLDLDPQSAGNVAVQFTAPTAGVYTFGGDVIGTDIGEQAHEVAITVDGSVVASGTIAAYRQELPFDVTESLAAGSTVDFISYSGSSYNNLGTGLSVTVSQDDYEYVPVSATIDNYATAAIEQSSGTAALSQIGNTYTLDFGTIASAPGEVSDTLDVANTATGQADWLTGSLSATSSSGLSDTGLGSTGTLQAGNTTPLTISLTTTGAGVFSQTITLAASSVNPDSSTPLQNETIDVIGTVLSTAALAEPVINEPSPIVLADVHVASLVADDQTTLNIENAGSAVLSGYVSSASGDAYGSGTITNLAPSGDDTTDITAGLNNTQAGSLSGTVTLSFTSGTNDVPLAPQTVSLTGDVYRYADPSVAEPGTVYVHVGDGVGGTDTQALVVENIAPADRFSEGLEATALGVVSGGLTSATGSTAEIVAGGTDSTSLLVGFSTATDGVVSGFVAVKETSDGAGVDTLGTTQLGTVDVPINVVVDNYATAAIQQTGGSGTLGQVDNTYTLDLGSFAANTGTVVSGLHVLNAAVGQADYLSGSLIATGDSAFSDTGLGTFGLLSEGNSTPFSVDLSTANSGVFSQTITLDATDSNPDYSAALTAETIDVVGTVLPSTSLAQAVINNPTIDLPDAHVTTGLPTDLTGLSISNTGSAALSASVGGYTGDGYGSGAVDQLPPGGTDSTDISVGVNNTSAGAKSGDVTIDFQSGANLITDGSFEDAADFVPDGNDGMLLSPGSTIIQGWTVIGGNPLGWYGPTSDFGLAAQQGGYFLDLTGYTDSAPFAGVSQTIATTAGDQYQLTFELGSSSYWGLPDSIIASAAGASETFTSSETGSNNWQTETLDFTATGSTTTISLLGTNAESYIGLDNVSVVPLGDTAPVGLNPQTVAVSGNVYNYATASVTLPSTVYLHVGDGTDDTETEALTVSNTAAPGAYSEGLEASGVGGAGGDITGASGTTGDIAAQGSETTPLSVTISTATASAGGTVAVNAISDGTGIDTLGTTNLGTIDVPLNVIVDNYATAAMEQTGGDGSMTPNATESTTYTLNLGSTEQYADPLTADLAALNAALGPAADQLDGSYSISGDSEYADTGFDSFTGVNYGNALGGNTVVLDTDTIGVFSQQITLTPTGTNASGYSGTLATETIDVVGTIVPVPPPPPAPLPEAIAWGDVHLTTFDGLYYNFQAEGEFILAQSTVAGDTFAVQARMEPYSANSTVSVMTMIGADVGGEQVTFGLGRDDVVAIAGAGQTFAGNGSSIALAGGGSVTQVTSSTWQLNWGTGEVMTVTDAGTYLNMSLTLSANDGPGSIQGLLGSDTGQANDFQLADGTVLAQPLTSAQLYGEFADAWRVTSGVGGNSLMDYLAGQGTATFTDDNFPADAVNVDNLPAAILQQAEEEVAQAGITGANQQAAAVLDLLVTGNPLALAADLDVDQSGEPTTAAEISVPPPPVPALGVTAVATNVVETAGGATDVTFNAYLTTASGTDTVIDWAVSSPNGTYLTPSSLGSNPTSGFITILAGQTIGQFTVALPTDVLGSDPSANLQVTISSTNGDPVFGATAQTEIDNYTPVAGNPAVPQLTLLSGSGTFSGSDGDYTVNLGTLVAGESPLQDRFQIANDALAPSDQLAGSIAATGTGFTVYGSGPISALLAQSSYQGLVTETDTSQTGAQSETIVYTPVDGNITGYSSVLPAQTVTITDTVLPDAIGTLETSGPINLGSFYEGELAQTPLTIVNAATAGSAALDVTATSSGGATATGDIQSLATGGTSYAIEAGINTSAPGVQTGYVTVDYASDAGNGNIASEGSATIEVIGTVYGPAAASFSAPIVYVHKGDDGGSVTVPITISNVASVTPFTENLDARIVNFGTYVTAASGSVTDLAPGLSNSTSLTATLSDPNYGTYAGEVEIALQSDGTGIDSEGTTSLGMAYVQAAIDVDQYAVAAMQQVGGDGTMVPTGVSTSYSLDLGTVAQYATPLGANLAALNDVLGQSDLVAGSFSLSGAPEFTNTGFGAFGPGTEEAGLAAGQEDTDPVIVLSSATVGVFTETVTFDPIDYNPSGYSGTLTPETVTITGTVVAAPPPTPVSRVSDAWGDVHLTTFDGLYYNFQAAGEFVLSESTIPGDMFAIQARMQPYDGSSSVSVNTMIGAEVGSDDVTFGVGRTDTVWVDGQGVSLSSDPVLTLADGTLEQTSTDTWRLVWNTGEELDITDEGSYLNATVSLPSSDAGNVQGLLGNDNGNPANDLTLPGGAPIATDGTISYAQLYGTYETSWLVNQSTSLMNYESGQDSASFYLPNFPYNQILLGNIPANAYAEALAAAEAAGITDPNLLQAAIVDYLFTGNPAALEASENVQQQEGTTPTSGTTVTAAPPPVADLGVLANEATVVELAGTADAIGFTAYLTSPEATDTLVEYSVNGNAGLGYLNGSDFPGDILPNGTVTIAAGQTSALFSVAIPASVLGTAPDANLQVVITPVNPEQSVFAPDAQTEILNYTTTAGNPATPLVELLSGAGLLTGSGTSYELNLGSVEQFSNPLLAGYGVENDGIVPADLLSGSFEVSGASQFLNSGLSPFAPIATGDADTAPEVELLTNTVGTFTENVTLTPTDSNLTNYSSVMPQVTIEVVGTITAPPPPPPPPVPEATAWGDVHITTFDGVYYNFQAAGEYVLTKSTVAGDTFQVQARLQPWGGNSSVTVQTQVGAAIGTDKLVFAIAGEDDDASPLYLNGTAEALGIGQTLTLSAGSVTETSANTYRVNWDTGESMTVTDNDSYISDSIELTAADAGNVQGLLGPDDGNPSTDLQLPDGQSLASNGTISSQTLYGAYETDWQVQSSQQSLLYYGTGPGFGGFNIPGFPEDALTLSQLPANLVSAAEAIVEAEGITNPNLVDAAVIDLLVTGNPNSVFSTENVQEEGVLLNSAAVSIPTPLPSVGIMADAATALEPTTGTIAVDYTVYLTAASAQTSTIDYSVTGTGPNNLGTADIVGGTGSGVVQIAAGQTSTLIVVDVLANALGSLPDAELQVGVTATGGETVFGSSAETEIVNPTPTAGNPAEALLEQLAGDGSLTGGGTDYVLNLGTQVQNGTDLYANLGIENGATVPADGLSGQFTITNFENYLNNGFVPFSNLTPGAADTEPSIELGTGTIGVYTERVVLAPTDVNDSGYSEPQNDVTLTVTGTIVPMPLPPPPSLPTATAWGDVHLTTFDGLYYNFQAIGEFTLAKSTVAGDNFNVQIRTTQYGNSSVSVIDQVAAGFGDNQAVTFGTSASQPSTVLLNGGAANFVNGVLTLADGSTVTAVSPTSYVVNWSTGESLTVTVGGSYINTTVALASQDTNGNVEGLLGYDNGVANDFAPIVSGTTINTTQLYYGNGTYDPGASDSLADYWRVSQADSLLYYASGDTLDYTDIGFPADALSLSQLPAALQQEGLQEAIQAGITNPQLQQAAALDYIVTGDPDIVTGGANVQQQGITTTDSDVTGGTVTPALGVSANNAALVEPTSGNLDVSFTVYLTEAEAQASTVDWAVDAPDGGYLNASDFAGDILPTGSIIIAAGSTSASFSVEVNSGVLGSLPSSDLQVTITPTGTESVFAPTAQTTIVNDEVEPGTPSDPLFALLGGEGTLTDIGNAYTLELGNFTQGETVDNLSLAVENAATIGSNDLAGSLTATSIPGYTVYGTGPLPEIAAGTSYQDLHVAVNTGTAGDYSETITFTPEDQNASGHSVSLTPLTLTIVDSVSGNYASASAASPNPVNFGNVHEGSAPSRTLSIENSAPTSVAAENLDGSIGSNTGAAIDNGGTFTGLQPGVTNSSSLSVGLVTTIEGVQTGTAVVSLESDGSGIDSNGITPLPSQTIDVVGTVYGYAAPVVTGTTLDFGAARVGGTVVAESISIADGTTANPYQESLIYALQNTPPTGFVPGSGDAGTIMSGGTTLASLDLATTTAGNFSATDTLSLTSTGLGTSGLANTTLPSETVTLEGKVYAAAVAQVGTVVNFGIVHVGSTAAKLLSIKNGAAGALTDVLTGDVGTITGSGFSSTGSLGAGLAAGSTGSLSLVLNTATSGVFDATATLDLASHDAYQADEALNVAPVTLTGTVDNFATAQVGVVSGIAAVKQIGGDYTINLGTLTAGSSPAVIELGVSNLATGLADVISGSFSIGNTSSAFINNGLTAFAGIGAGQADIAPTITLAPGGDGFFSETITLATEDSNASGFIQGMPGRTLTVEGTMVSGITLTPGTDTVNGNNNVTIYATSSDFQGGDHINGGSGTNTLVLEGGGVFNLGAPAALNDIQVVDLKEGPSTSVYLRSGTSLTVDVLPALTNPTTAGVVIHGANNDDTINLGAGYDTVYLGGSGEIVNGGSGSDTYNVTAATIGATITGHGGSNILSVMGGGDAVMGSNITGVTLVYLSNPGTFTANATSGLTIRAFASGETVAVGSPGQTVIGSKGTLQVLATAATAGARVAGGSGGAGSNTLDIGGGGTITLNGGDSNLTVQLLAASTLDLTTTLSVVIEGSTGNDVFVAQAGGLRTGMKIDGGGGVNTLALEGSGVFDLRAPAALNNIQVVDITEGSGTSVYLRNGTSLTVDVLPALTNPTTAGVVIHGANNDDTINLGAGYDTVYLGGTGEIVNGGGGTDIYNVTAATIGATITGHGGTNILSVMGGGNAVMGSNITGITRVLLETAGTSYNFTANATQGLVIQVGTDNDTVTVGSGSQEVIGSSGSLVVEATAANAGVKIAGGSGSTELEITNSGTATLNSTDNNLTAVLQAANTTLTLDHMTFIHAEGIGAGDTIIAGAAGQVLTGGGGNDTLEDAGHYGVTFQDTVAGIVGDTLADFSSLDTIDISNLALGSVTGMPTYTGSYGSAGSGTLAVATNTGTLDIKLTGLASGGVFSVASDTHGGVFITYS